MMALWLSVVCSREGRQEGESQPGVPAPGPMAAVCWARLGSMNPKGWSYCRGRNGAAPLAAP